MEDNVTFKEVVIASHPTGSRYICNPPAMNTDNDTIILVNGYFDWANLLREEGWEDCGKDYENEPNFRAFRKGEDNYIVTEDEKWFERYVLATEGAKALNLTNKEDRIKLFQAVCNASYRMGLVEPHVPNKFVIKNWRQQIFREAAAMVNMFEAPF